MLDSLLTLRDGAKVRLVINSGGGSVIAGLGIATLIEWKRLQATAVVLADCSSSALLIFASCRERIVAPHASFLFHPMRWAPDERAGVWAATEWAREFRRIEGMTTKWISDRLGIPLAKMKAWERRETFVSGTELVEAGVAKFLALDGPATRGSAPKRKPRAAAKGKRGKPATGKGSRKH